MLGHTLIGIVDNFMVGKLGSTELAAVSLGTQLYIHCLIIRDRVLAITPLVAEADAENDVSKFDHVSSRFAFMYGFRSCIIYFDRVV
jgi:MATE family multidrug resistance protein